MLEFNRHKESAVAPLQEISPGILRTEIQGTLELLSEQSETEETRGEREED